MAPPTDPLNLDVEAISGICGSISIACWVVVFSPQIVENFRRGSVDGLSIQFIVVWLAGDVFNILGAVFQGVLPTMIILAFYYTLADIVLLGQCFYYRGFTLRDNVSPPSPPAKPKRNNPRRTVATPTERTRLLDDGPLDPALERRNSASDWTHLSPAVPLVVETTPPPPPTKLQAAGWNLLAILMVCAAGVAGWWLSRTRNNTGQPKARDNAPLEFDYWGQVFGWLCAALYLGSRLPQLLLNWRRKSTEGVSMLFFLFACLGNLTYVLSIMAYEPNCGTSDDVLGPLGCQDGEAVGMYWRYILVNLSWLAGSFGTLLLDLGIFVQFFIYSKEDEDEDSGSDDGSSTMDEEESIGELRWDQRPVLERNVSDWQ